MIKDALFFGKVSCVSDVPSGFSKASVRAMPYAKAYFNFMSYSLFILLILGICYLMRVFNKKEISLTFTDTAPMLQSLAMQLLFGLVFISVALVVSRKKRQMV